MSTYRARSGAFSRHLRPKLSTTHYSMGHFRGERRVPTSAAAGEIEARTSKRKLILFLKAFAGDDVVVRRFLIEQLAGDCAAETYGVLIAYFGYTPSVNRFELGAGRRLSCSVCRKRCNYGVRNVRRRWALGSSTAKCKWI